MPLLAQGRWRAVLDLRRGAGLMSRQPRRPRSVKVEDDLWEPALKKADERGEVLSEEIRKFLKRYVARR